MSKLTNRHKHTVMALITVALLSLLLDPYSFGDAGGELSIRSNAWQMMTAAVQVSLLVVAARLVWLRAYPKALKVALAESLLFLVLNVLFVLRDSASRFSSGYSADTTIVFVFVLGFAARCLSLAILQWRVRAEHTIA